MLTKQASTSCSAMTRTGSSVRGLSNIFCRSPETLMFFFSFLERHIQVQHLSHSRHLLRSVLPPVCARRACLHACPFGQRALPPTRLERLQSPTWQPVSASSCQPAASVPIKALSLACLTSSPIVDHACFAGNSLLGGGSCRFRSQVRLDQARGPKRSLAECLYPSSNCGADIFGHVLGYIAS